VIIYEYVDDGAAPEFTTWRGTLEKRQQAKLDAKTMMIRRVGLAALSHEMLPRVGGGIYKLRIHGNVALRPMLCAGPLDENTEATLLVPAVERDRQLEPGNAIELAKSRRDAIKANPRLRMEYREDLPE